MTTTRPTLEANSIAPGLTVNDLDKSIRFYEGLGFSVDDRWEEGGKLVGVMLRAGNALLGLSQDDFAKGRDRVKGIGLRIFVSTDQDVDELATQANAAGVPLDGHGPLPWGPRGLWTTDPDGFKITISQETD